MSERMTIEERLDWLCRLRAFLVSVGMPNEWRAKFIQALSDSITELSVEQSENTMMDAAIDEWRGEMDNAIKRALKKQRWIPVSERLPEKNMACLVAVGEFNLTQIARYSDLMGIKNHRIFYQGDYGNDNFENITQRVNAWMPLPKPYKPQESEG